MDDLKGTTMAAVGFSLVLVGQLLLFVTHVVGQPKAEVNSWAYEATVLAMTCLTIRQWIRCAKQYIDRAIDRKLAPSDRE